MRARSLLLLNGCRVCKLCQRPLSSSFCSSSGSKEPPKDTSAGGTSGGAAELIETLSRIVSAGKKPPSHLALEKDLAPYRLSEAELKYAEQMTSDFVPNLHSFIEDIHLGGTFPFGRRFRPVTQDISSMSKAQEDFNRFYVINPVSKNFSNAKVFLRSLKAYVHACVLSGKLNYAEEKLFYHSRANSRHSKRGWYDSKLDSATFNILLEAYGQKANIKQMRMLLKLMEAEGNCHPNMTTVYTWLLCAINTKVGNEPIAAEALKLCQKHKLNVNNIFLYRLVTKENRVEITQLLEKIHPRFTPTVQPYSGKYPGINPLLEPLNRHVGRRILDSPYCVGLSKDQLMESFKEQMNLEMSGTIEVESVALPSFSMNSGKTSRYQDMFSQLKLKWRADILKSFQRRKASIGSSVRGETKSLNVFPFLSILDDDVYADIVFNKVLELATLSGGYSDSLRLLHIEMGKRVMRRVVTHIKKQLGVPGIIEDIYNNYLNYFTATELSPKTHREFWQKSVDSYCCLTIPMWPSSILTSIGALLYDIILEDVKVYKNQSSTTVGDQKNMEPAFYVVYRNFEFLCKEEITPHPGVIALIEKAKPDKISFEAEIAPMVVPPLPWTTVDSGGFLILQTDFERFREGLSDVGVLNLKKTPIGQLLPIFDSLNQLGSIPWIVNQPILDVVLEIFQNKGDIDLAIPPSVEFCEEVPFRKRFLDPADKATYFKSRAEARKKRAETYSLWCSALYKLSLASHFRNRVVWFPFNLDFRGRVYPVPPFFNHMGDDVSRSLLVFAKGQPLGKHGLDWLKIHCINLTGLKKKGSLKERLQYANEVLPDIIDSARFPLTGKCWWKSSDEPFQTLGACMEIDRAIQSQMPELYVSHFPVHQDGSCNGLQHYSALGRDKEGAKQVNLAPAERPGDVYSAVADGVELLRKTDSQNGLLIAKVLEGYIERKIVKQTVMTTVYGVTMFGARLQIAKRLKEAKDFPQDQVFAASHYLAKQTFKSLTDIFKQTSKIQQWFTELATVLTTEARIPVHWITPLGLPVVQPYFIRKRFNLEPSSKTKLQKTADIAHFIEVPNSVKQRNAFPPNYIHSLDSTHMMLTSLHCLKQGITYMSVHDCFWTHPASINVMSEICRQQFVALHCQPLLAKLAVDLAATLHIDDRKHNGEPSMDANQKKYLSHLLNNIPKQGEFDLNLVLKSPYFFS